MKVATLLVGRVGGGMCGWVGGWVGGWRCEFLAEVSCKPQADASDLCGCKTSPNSETKRHGPVWEICCHTTSLMVNRKQPRVNSAVTNP